MSIATLALCIHTLKSELQSHFVFNELFTIIFYYWKERDRDLPSVCVLPKCLHSQRQENQLRSFMLGLSCGWQASRSLHKHQVPLKVHIANS